MDLALFPHNDDESLFCAYTLMREKPIVAIVFDSYVQNWTTAEERRMETTNALELIKIAPIFLGLNDAIATEEDVRHAISNLKADHYYASTGSHKHHEMLGRLAKELWKGKVTFYTTYSGDNLHEKGDWVILPSPEEIEMKNRMLDCYKSQLVKNAPHFEAVRGQPEYYE